MMLTLGAAVRYSSDDEDGDAIKPMPKMPADVFSTPTVKKQEHFLTAEQATKAFQDPYFFMHIMSTPEPAPK